jgi:hypothetical protein
LAHAKPVLSLGCTKQGKTTLKNGSCAVAVGFVATGLRAKSRHIGKSGIF